ncbi:MAG: alpha-amylase family glycosyl hydrolase [Nitrospirota bacterium]|nr:alpha-amylase family glycosyl hydrolase [Nitrospirota bacterium]
MTHPTPPLIYNLFPLLAGPFTGWQPHLERARGMGFNWLYFNPVSYPGFSGSLYSVKNYYGFHPLLSESGDAAAGDAFATVLKSMHNLGLTPMMDLVINHTAIDSPLIEEHPAWYQWQNGRVVRPGALHDTTWVEWGDLASVDNAHSADRDSLWDYWDRLIAHHQRLGVRGFRCDAAYQVPVELWRHLITRARERDPGATFFAETLGCPVSDIIALAGAGFSFTFNSSKWWDLIAPWCLEQYRQTRPHIATVAFAESHDTPRLAAECRGDVGTLLARHALACLFSTGVMMPMGFEFAARQQMHVVTSRPGDLHPDDGNRADLCAAITEINHLKLRHQIFREEGPMEPGPSPAEHVTALQKSTVEGTLSALILVSRERGMGVPEPRPDGWREAVELTPASLLEQGAPLRVLLRAAPG